MFRITQGYSVGYLTGPVSQGREGYYTGAVAAGEPPGLWYGAGAEALGLRGEVDADLVEAIYARLLDPRDPATHSRATWDEAAALAPGHKNYKDADTIYGELAAREAGAGPERRAELRAQAERSARQAVAFEDATFSAQKSVTVLGAAFERMANDARKAGDTRAAEAWDTRTRAVEDAVMAGARASIDYLQDAAGYARRGHHGGGSGRWIDAHEFVVAQFLQHDSRDRDPQLHVHQAILNRVQGADGEWTGLHGRTLRNYRWSAAAVGERVMEAHLSRSLGVRFETRPDGKAREVVGVSQDVMDLFSQRRRAVTGKTAELVKAYTDRFGREPSIVELKNIQQEAALATRKAKSHDGETLEQRLDRWERQARTAVAGGLREVAQAALEQGRQGAGRPDDVSPQFVIKRALDAVGEHRSTWTRSDLMFAVSSALPANLDIAPEKVRPLLEKLTDEAMAQAVVVKPQERTEGLPKELLLANGRPVYEAPGGARYATPGQVAEERLLLEAAVRTGAASLTTEQADAVINRFAENGVELGADQAAAVRGVLTSGARVEVLAAAAGTGKSFTVGAIAESWAEHGHRTFGLAPSQVAADVLAEERVNALNLARWRGAQERLDEGRAQNDDESFRLREGDLVVVDEAGMAATSDLADVAVRCDRAGAKLLLVGDARQLAAVGPGGAMADVGERAAAYELTEVRRFRAPWEGEASLRLRDADRSAIDEYDKHGRVHDGGTAEQAEAAASRAWLADTLAGKQSLLLVGSNEAAARVSAQLRAELVRLGRVSEDGVTLGRDGNTAGVGDMVQARRNGWHLRGHDGNAKAPINRETFTVIETRSDGALRVAKVLGRDADGAVLDVPITLPQEYVAEHLALAYASTVNAAQGRNVDTGHGVTGPGTPAANAYVMGTRGQEENHFWVITQSTPSDAPVGEAQNVEPRAAKAVLEEVLERAEEQRGALAEQEQAAEDAASTVTTVDRLLDGLAMANAGRTSGLLDRLTATDVITADQRQELAADRAMGSVERLLRHAEVAGRDPDEVLHTVLDGNSLDGANFPARVLHKRIRDEVGEPAPRITSYHDLIPDGLDETWNRELHRLAEASDDRRRELGSRTADAALGEEPPKWALDTLGPVPEDPVGRAEWEHRAGWAAAHRENARFDDEVKPIGPAPPPGLPEKHAIWWTAHDELGLPDVGPAEEQMSDGRLLARWAAWEREQAWAPRYVDDEMAATSETAAARRVDAELWSARAETIEDPVEARQLRDAAAEARGEAVELDLRASELEVVSQARAEWFVHTAETRDAAMRAQAALEARGVDVEHPPDVTTAEAYLAAQAEGQLAEDPHRVIHETDVVVERDETPTVSEVRDTPVTDETTAETETAAPDIRLEADVAAAPVEKVEVAQELPAVRETPIVDIAADPEPDMRETPAVETPADVVVELEVPETVGEEPSMESAETVEISTPAATSTDVEREVPDTRDARGAEATTAPTDTVRAETPEPDVRELEDAEPRREPPAELAPDAEVPAGKVDADEPRRGVEDADEPAVPRLETAVPDIRETSAADPTEVEDPDPRRQVASADDTAEWVAKARDALTEIQARNAADEARNEPAEERVDRRTTTDSDELVRGM
jgi:conjugative relaxase-like TrwC/TraI family protein